MEGREGVKIVENITQQKKGGGGGRRNKGEGREGRGGGEANHSKT